MPYQLVCIDDPEKPGLRNRIRAEHLRYMIAHRDVILFGGPLKGPDGASIGSAFALSYDDRADVDAFLAEEPYTVAGLFSRLEIYPIAVMMPERRPGFLQEELARELGSGEAAR